MPAAFASLPSFPFRLLLRVVGKKRSAQRQHDSLIPLSILQPSQSSSSSCKQPRLVALGNDAILGKIASHLHYIDVINLSLTCRSMYQTICPMNGHSKRFELLCIASCSDGSKEECWGCARQICEVTNNKPSRDSLWIGPCLS